MTHERPPLHVPPPRPIVVKLEGPIRIEFHIYQHAVPGKDDAAMRKMAKTIEGGTEAMEEAIKKATPTDPPIPDGQPT